MLYIRLMPLVTKSSRKALREAHLAVHTPQQEGPKVRRHGPPLDIGAYRMTRHGRKAELCWARLGHKQTSCGLDGMDFARIFFYQRLTRGLSLFVKNSG